MTKHINLIFIMIIFVGCVSYHSISKDSLVYQAKSNGQKFYVITDSIEGYEFSKIEQIECINKDDELVIISVDHNTNLEVYPKSGNVVKMYFGTVKLYSDTLYGLRSRILGIPRKIALKDIDRIEIYSEFKSEKKKSK